MKVLSLLCLMVILCVGSVWADIFEYCARADSSYQWNVASSMDLEDGSRVVDLHLTSQTWMDIPWKHTVRMVIPKGSGFEHCGLYITGGDPNDRDLPHFRLVAGATQWPIATVYNIPNQPLFDGLNEDALISYTFVQFMETGNKDWPLLFPMTKSVIRAMDAIQEYMLGTEEIKIQGFLTFGASKRGWTTWFSTVVDPRVKGAVPIVYDNLNLTLQMPHQIQAFGAYSEQIDDYSEKGLPDMLTSDLGKEVARLVDPFTYRKRSTCPKLMIIGTNDRYWPLDALNLYYKDLYGKNYILYVPNNGHGVNDMPRVLGGIGAVAKMVDGTLPFPELKSECVIKDGTVVFLASAKPDPFGMRVWMAEAPTRDFRDAEWVSEEMTKVEECLYRFEIEVPHEGYGALFGEYIYKIGERSAMLSTNVYLGGPDPNSGEMVLLSQP